MNKINFEDGVTKGNATTFNQMQKNIEEAINGVVLYENSSGSTGTITLSDSVVNYKSIKIHYKNGDNYYDSKEIDNPNGKRISLDLNYRNAGTNAFQHWAGEINISEKSISHSIDYYYQVPDLNGEGIQSINYLYITKVVGYK